MVIPRRYCLVADNVKNRRKLPFSNPKPDLHNTNAHVTFGENLPIFTQVIVWKKKYGWTDERHLIRVYTVCSVWSVEILQSKYGNEPIHQDQHNLPFCL